MIFVFSTDTILSILLTRETPRFNTVIYIYAHNGVEGGGGMAYVMLRHVGEGVSDQHT